MANIKGKWKWNETFTYADLSPVSGYVNFTCDAQEYTKIELYSDVYWGESGPQPAYSLRYITDNNMQTIVLYYCEDGSWSSDLSEQTLSNMMVVDFGSEQWIDDDLYSFIVNNAEPLPLTMAEKLQLIAENQQRVYDAGYLKGYDDGHGDSDENYRVGYSDGYDVGHKEGIAEGNSTGYNFGFTEGKQAEYDAFWDAYQANGTRKDYQYGAFGGNGWNDNSYKPKYTPQPVHAYSMFQGCHITEITNVDFSTTSSIEGCFAYSSKLQKIGEINAANLTSCKNSFRLCPKLETIELLKLNENTAIDNNTFASLPELINITIEGNINGNVSIKESTKLTSESITSIVNALWDGASGKTLTLSKAAVDEAWRFITEVDGETVEVPGSEMTGWLNLAATKPNWTITLV